LSRRRWAAEFPREYAGPCELLLKTAGRAVQGITVVRQEALDVDRVRDVPGLPSEPPVELALDLTR